MAVWRKSTTSGVLGSLRKMTTLKDCVCFGKDMQVSNPATASLKGENKMKKSFVCACGKKFKTYNLYWFHLCSVGHSKKHYAVTATKQRQNDKMFKSGFDCCVE
jgi:hypothetical protein